MESHTRKQRLLNKVAAITRCKEWFLDGPCNCFKQPSIVLALKEVVYDGIVVDWREYFVKIWQLSTVLCWVGANDTLTCVCYNIEGHSIDVIQKDGSQKPTDCMRTNPQQEVSGLSNRKSYLLCMCWNPVQSWSLRTLSYTVERAVLHSGFQMTD